METIDLHVELLGGGPPVLVVHGAPQPPDDLLELARRLGVRYRVGVVHLPGYGESPHLRHRYELCRVNEAIETAARQHGMKRPAIVGVSGGSYRAFGLVLREPRWWRAMIHLGPLACVSDADREAMRALADVAPSRPDLSEAFVPRMFSRSFAAAYPETCRAVCERMSRAADPLTLAAELGAFADSPDLLPELTGLPVPCLVRVGEQDVATPAAHARAIAAQLPDCELQVVAGSGHLLNHEDLDATAHALSSFLSQHLEG